MAEKILNTRIQLKRDSLTNWNQSSVVLKPGEVGVAYVDVATKDAKGNIVHVPTALLKVGENVPGSTKTFKDLPFVSAVAADVYAWAKEAGFYVETLGEGEAIAGVEFKATETHPNGALVVTKTDLVTPDELTTALGGYYTKDEINTKIQEINGTNSGLANRVKDLEDKEATYGDIVTHNAKDFAPADIDTGVHAVSLASGTNNGTVKLTVDDTTTDNIAVTGLGDAAYTTVAALNATAQSYADGKDEAIAAAKKAGDDAADALDTYKGEMTTALAGKADKSVVDAMYTNSKIDELLSAKQDTIPAETYDAFGSAAAVEAKLADYTKTADLDTTIDGYGYLKAADVANKADKATTLAGYGITDAYTKDEADAAFTTAAEVEDVVDAALARVSDTDTIEGITTLVEYVNTHGTDLAAITKEIYGDSGKVGDDPSRIDTAVADAAQAKADAAQAVADAAEAKTAAEEAANASDGAVAAQEAAEAAQAAAEAAQGKAEAAQTAASNSAAAALASEGNAKTSETNAKASEEAAAGSASAAATAAGNASNAQTAAEAARDAAVAAKQAAETAETNAETAETNAKAAQTAAETAQGKAEDAQAAAEQAKADANDILDQVTDVATGAQATANSAVETANAAANKADAAKTAADAATTAVAGLHAIATSGNVKDLVQDTGDVLVFDCGTSTTVL